MKALKALALVAGVLALSSTQAFAVPTIDGNVGAGEWANAGYPYYLELLDPNELDNKFDNMDISHVVLLQELGGSVADDGVYLLVEVYDPAVSLEDPADDPSVPPTPTATPIVNMSGDFEGDGVYDIHIRTFNAAPSDGVENSAQDVVQVCLGSSATCHPVTGAWFPFSAGGGVYQRGNALEYFFPTGSFGTPSGVPFPSSFTGVITFDNGASGLNTSDDIVFGSAGVIPEPGTMFLLGSGLLGLFGVRKKQQMM